MRLSDEMLGMRSPVIPVIVLALLMGGCTAGASDESEPAASVNAPSSTGGAAPATEGASPVPAESPSTAPADPPSAVLGLVTAEQVAAYLENAGIDPEVTDNCGVSGLPVVSSVRMTYAEALHIGQTLTDDERWPGVRGSENRFLTTLAKEDPGAMGTVCTLAVDSSGIPPFDRDVTVWYSNGTFGEIGMYVATYA